MPDPFNRALAFVLQWEGGFSDTPGDSGGATNKGVTQAVYNAYRKSQGDPLRSVRLIAPAEVEGIYRTRYWQAVRADELRWPLSLAVFDLAVNAGVKRAVVLLQRAVGVVDDGKFGPLTLAAAERADPHAAALRVCEEREAFYRAIVARKPSQGKFLVGWLRRVEALKAAARKD